MTVSETAISYSEAAGEHSIQKQDVRTVKLMENKHRLRNTLIGAGVGAAAGGSIGAATSCSGTQCIFGRGAGAAVGAVALGVPGAIIGAFVPSHDTVYNVNSH
jgi:hypothetical protein